MLWFCFLNLNVGKLQQLKWRWHNLTLLHNRMYYIRVLSTLHLCIVELRAEHRRGRAEEGARDCRPARTRLAALWRECAVVGEPSFRGAHIRNSCTVGRECVARGGRIRRIRRQRRRQQGCEKWGEGRPEGARRMDSVSSWLHSCKLIVLHMWWIIERRNLWNRDFDVVFRRR